VLLVVPSPSLIQVDPRARREREREERERRQAEEVSVPLVPQLERSFSLGIYSPSQTVHRLTSGLQRQWCYTTTTRKIPQPLFGAGREDRRATWSSPVFPPPPPFVPSLSSFLPRRCLLRNLGRRSRRRRRKVDVGLTTAFRRSGRRRRRRRPVGRFLRRRSGRSGRGRRP
jgi:hypothetical protein